MRDLEKELEITGNGLKLKVDFSNYSVEEFLKEIMKLKN